MSFFRDTQSQYEKVNLTMKNYKSRFRLHSRAGSSATCARTLQLARMVIGIPSMLVHKCCEQIAEPLSVCFNMSLEEGYIPDCFKSAACSNTYLQGWRKIQTSKLSPSIAHFSNYETFRKNLRKVNVNHLDTNMLMNNSQHGFRKGRSCLSALLEVYNEIMTSISDPDVNCIDMVYLDFAKAFDKVDHHILLRKLKHFGITKQVGIWLASFLSDRKQFVQIPGGISVCSQVSSGVPQGTVLGPVL